ncbi:hypothetical protein ABEW32_04925 [Paenibacillus jamilae]|uniref:hypothetical protein n=1 Tax=Paenibacillus jamilae TaxID=114136 RepID=UPI003D291397
MLSNITVLPDESLGGIEREYREVNRKAVTGERIKIVNPIASFGDYERGDVMTVYSTGSGGVHTVETAEGWDGGGHIFIGDDEYVVLELTDIVHLPVNGRVSGTERLRMVDRKAAVGERVIMTAATGTRIEGGRSVPDYNNGDIFEIARINDGADLAISTSEKLFYHREYHVLESLTAAPLLSEQSAQDQAAATISALALRLDALEETVQRIDTDVRVAKEDIDIMDESIAYDVRKLEAEVATLKDAATTYLKTQPATPTDVIASLARHRTAQQNIKAARQQRRDEIVERAKADVADLLSHNYPGAAVAGVWLSERDWITVTDECEFTVNRKKRTVVALIRELETGKKNVILRGIAKCAPGDVFNAHIGKAISLRRALGLEVPAEYLNVPQPTEVRVGDVVRVCGNGSGGLGHYYDIGDVGRVVDRNQSEGWAGIYGLRTRQPSRSQYGYEQGVHDADYEVIDDTSEEVAA